MTEIREQIYRLMDSFLVETDKPRPLDRLNQDRHLFVENMEEAIRSWALDIVGEDDDVKDWFSDYIGYNRAKSEIRKKIEVGE